MNNEKFVLKETHDIDLNKVNFSSLKVDKLDKAFENDFNGFIQTIIDDLSKEYAKQYDKAMIKSAIIKAQLYDLSFNPYTVRDNEKHKMIRDFCKWVLSKIEDEKLNKKEIVRILKEYSKE